MSLVEPLPVVPVLGEVDKVEIGLATLYKGDCVQIASVIERADHTITDPPYEAGAHTKSRLVHTASGLEVRAHKFEAMDEETRSAITKRCVEITKKWILVFCQNEGIGYWIDNITKFNGRYHSTMAWIKPDAKPNFMGNGPGVGWECIVSGWCDEETKKSWNGGGRNGHFVIPAWDKTANVDGTNIHTSIKPQKLMGELVALFTNKDEIIFDPFMGSGSTGVAAVNAGRRFIGIERDPEYFEISCRRIEAAQKSDLVSTSVYVKTKAKVTVPLIDAPVPKAKVVKTITKRTAAAPKAQTQSKPRFGIPTINVNGATTQRAQQIPWANPFEAYAKPIVDNARGQPLVFDPWPETRKRHLAMDVECYRNFFLVCFLDLRTGQRHTLERSTRTDFKGSFLRDIIENNRIVTFNGMVYDMPMVHLAISGAECAELKSASDTIIKERLKHWEVERRLPRAKVPYGLDHIDLYEPNPAVRTGLKVLMGRMHRRFIVDLPYEEHRSLTADEMNFVTLYCFNDLDGTKGLYEHLQEPLELRRVLSNEYKVDMRSKSDAQMGEAIFKKRIGNVGRPQPMPTFFYKVPEFIKFDSLQMKGVLANLAGTEFTVDPHTGKADTPPWLEGLEVRFGTTTYRMGRGGVHSTEANRALHSDDDNLLIDIDVTGYYPNFGVKLGMYPKAAGPKYIEVGRGMIDERSAAKQKQLEIEAAFKKKEEYPPEYEALRSKAEGGKIAANGAMFGKLGSEYSFLFAPDILFAVTMGGQLSLLMMVERFERAGIPCLSGNTDGIVVRCPRTKLDDLNSIVARWEDDIGFKVERTEYRSIYNSSVNSYFAVKTNGKMKRKGPAANPWGEGDKRGMLSKNPQMTICGDAVAQYILNGTPFEDTIRGCTDPRQFLTVIKADAGAKWRDHVLGGVVRYYWSIDGDDIRYKESNRKVAKTAGARPLIELGSEVPADLDYDRYVAEAEKLAIEMAVINEKGALL